MRTERDHSIAYPLPVGSSAFGLRPSAGFSGIAYRLAHITAPRIGVVSLIAALFYFL